MSEDSRQMQGQMQGTRSSLLAQQQDQQKWERDRKAQSDAMRKQAAASNHEYTARRNSCSGVAGEQLQAKLADAPTPAWTPPTIFDARLCRHRVATQADVDQLVRENMRLDNALDAVRRALPAD